MFAPLAGASAAAVHAVLGADAMVGGNTAINLAVARVYERPQPDRRAERSALYSVASPAARTSCSWLSRPATSSGFRPRRAARARISAMRSEAERLPPLSRQQCQQQTVRAHARRYGKALDRPAAAKPGPPG